MIGHEMKPSEKFWCRISVDIIHGQNVEGKSERLIFRRMSRCASLYWPPPKGSELEQMLAPDVLKRWNFDIFRQHISNLYDHTVRAAVLNQRAIFEIQCPVARFNEVSGGHPLFWMLMAVLHTYDLPSALALDPVVLHRSVIHRLRPSLLSRLFAPARRQALCFCPQTRCRRSLHLYLVGIPACRQEILCRQPAGLLAGLLAGRPIGR